MTDQSDGPRARRAPRHDGPRPGPANARPPGGEHYFRRLEHLAHALGADDELPIDPDLSPEDEARPALTHRRPPTLVTRPRRARVDVLAVIFVGGFLGTLGRYGVERALPAASGHFPTGTFVVNTTGALVLGLLVTVLVERLRRPHALARPFAVTGVLGGWTTYSSLVVETVGIGHDGHLAMAAGYLAVTLVCGVVGVALGIGLARSRRLDALGAVAPDAWIPAPAAGDPDATSPGPQGARR